MPMPGTVLADPGKRVLAYVVDATAGLLLGGGFVAAGSWSYVVTQNPTSAGLVGLGALVLLAFTAFQWWYLGARGWTLGKRLVGIRVLDAGTGRPVGLARAFIRLLVPALGSLAFGVGQLVVLASPLFDRNGLRQGWHDRAAGTVVLDVGLGLDPVEAPQSGDVSQRIDSLLAYEQPSVWPGLDHDRDAEPTAPVPAGAPPADRSSASGTWPGDVAAPSAPAPTALPSPAGGVTAPGWPAASSGPSWTTPTTTRSDDDAMFRPPAPTAAPTPTAAPATPTPPHNPATLGPGRFTRPTVVVGREAPGPGPTPPAALAADVISTVPGLGPDAGAAPVPGDPALASPVDRHAKPTEPDAPGDAVRRHGAAEAPTPASGPVPTSGTGGAAPGSGGQGAGPTGDTPAAVPDVLTSPPVPDPAGPPPSADLPDDVERTRLRPARGKVPELANAVPGAVLELTDGRRIQVQGVALLGRDPAPRPGEEVDQLVPVADPGRSVSKTHLAVGVDRNGAWVRDRDSTNGTVVTLADGQQILCAADQQVRLPVGASVAFGDHGFSVVAAG